MEMKKNHVIVTGSKESFLVRVLVKKLKDADMDSEFVPWTVNDINARWNGTDLITIFMDTGERPGSEVLQFLIDRMTDEAKHLILIGEDRDVELVRGQVPADMIYRAFVRPVDNEAYVASVRELFQKVAAGEFKKSILIVDDAPNYMGLVREWLKGTYKVAMANSGLQAIKWLGKNKADLILLDHEMPVTTGPQVLEMLRNDEETRRIPVIFLTGKGDKQSVMAVVALKPEGYFLKTIEKNELLEKLDEFFKTHR